MHQTVCINTAINQLLLIQQQEQQEQRSAGLPAGVTGNWAANVVTISGTPTATVEVHLTIQYH